MLHHLGFGGIDRECQHVGRSGLAHVAVVELGHLALADEQHREFGKAAHPLGEHDVERELLPPFEIDGNVDLLVGTEDFRHTIAADTLLPCQTGSAVVTHFRASLRSALRSASRSSWRP